MESCPGGNFYSWHYECDIVNCNKDDENNKTNNSDNLNKRKCLNKVAVQFSLAKKNCLYMFGNQVW